jgi:hypothetical protein
VTKYLSESNLFWLVVLEVSAHGWLAPLILGRTSWHKVMAYLMEARLQNEREEGLENKI